MSTKQLLEERELLEAVDLCLRDGRLNPAAVGWSRSPLHRCNLPDSLARKKRWNYWCVTSEELLLSATIVDLDFAQLAFAYYYDRATHEFAEQTVAVAGGTSPMPETPGGSIAIEGRGMSVALADEGTGTRLTIRADDFRGKLLSADVHIERPPGHETLNVVIPWSDELYQYTSKQNTLPARGSVLIGERTYELRAPAYACLDYGRGVWPQETRWNWGSASGVQDGRVLGLNLGGGWTDGTGMTENAVCIDGRLTKINEDLAFAYDRADLARPWEIRTTVTDRIKLRFEPEYERVSKGGNDAYYSETHQVFGAYHGLIAGDGVEPIEVVDLFGWIEDHMARW